MGYINKDNGVYIRDSILQETISGNEKILLSEMIYLSKNSDYKVAYPSLKHLENKLRLPKRTIQRCINNLVDQGYITKDRELKNGTGYIAKTNYFLSDKTRVIIGCQNVTILGDETSLYKVSECHQLGDNMSSNRCQSVTCKKEEKRIKKDLLKNICANATPFDPKMHFEEFWNLYPKKVNKKKAKDKFCKVCKNEEIFKQLMNGLNIQIKSKNWLKENGQYIPHPTTWLNGERWMDEISGKEVIQTVTYEEMRENDPFFEDTL